MSVDSFIHAKFGPWPLIFTVIHFILDFNECSSEDFHDCDGTADCINDEMGTYSCEYLDGYIGSGDHSEEGSGSRDEQGSAGIIEQASNNKYKGVTT